jgi:hypothetical protein
MLGGKAMGWITKKQRSKEFLEFFQQVEHNTLKDKDFHLILDKSSMPETEAVMKWFTAHS